MTKTPRGLNEAPREYKLEDTVLQIRKIGNSVGVILPKELLARLNLKEGDKFYPVEQPDGSLRLSPFNPKHRADDGNRPQGHARISRYVCRACKMSEPIWLDPSMKSSTCMPSNWRYSADRKAFGIMALLESAVMRPVNQWNYGQTDMAALAAAYAFGLARNHAFVDGNKRTRVPRHDGLFAGQRHPVCAGPGARHGHHPFPRRGRGQRGKPDPLDPG